MWVSRKEFDALKNELEAVKREFDSHRLDVERERNFEVYESYTMPLFISYMNLKKGRISLKSVVSELAARCGLELKYVEGTPTKIELVKKSKKAA